MPTCGVRRPHRPAGLRTQSHRPPPKREAARGTFLARDIGTKRDLFNDPCRGPAPGTPHRSSTALAIRCADRAPAWRRARARCRQNPSATVSSVASPRSHSSGPGRNTQSIRISRVTTNVGGDACRARRRSAPRAGRSARIRRESRRDRAAGRAQHLEHHRVVDAAAMAGRDRAARAPARRRPASTSAVSRTAAPIRPTTRPTAAQRLAHRDRRNVGKALGHLAHQRFLLRAAADRPRRDGSAARLRASPAQTPSRN